MNPRRCSLYNMTTLICMYQSFFLVQCPIWRYCSGTYTVKSHWVYLLLLGLASASEHTDSRLEGKQRDYSSGIRLSLFSIYFSRPFFARDFYRIFFAIAAKREGGKEEPRKEKFEVKEKLETGSDFASRNLLTFSLSKKLFYFDLVSVN